MPTKRATSIPSVGTWQATVAPDGHSVVTKKNAHAAGISPAPSPMPIFERLAGPLGSPPRLVERCVHCCPIYSMHGAATIGPSSRVYPATLTRANAPQDPHTEGALSTRAQAAPNVPV